MTDSPGREQGDLERRVLFQMRRITQQHAARWQEQLPEITKAQYGVLRSLLPADAGLPQAEVGERTATDKATLAQLVARLEARGLVRRTVAATDRRRRVVLLTEAGRRVCREHADAVVALDREVLAPLAAEDRRHLLRLLDALAP